MDAREIANWISTPRFARYMLASGQDPARALRLYEWHGELAAACFGAMHHFEVLVRNAIDAELGQGQPDTPLTATWLMDAEILRPSGIEQVEETVVRLRFGGQTTRGQVVAGLSFGFWSSLFGGQYEELWRRRLRHAFPHAKQRKDVSTRIETLRLFRNRVAHHDCLLGQPVAARHQTMLEVASFVDPNAGAWLGAISRVDGQLAAKPQ